MIWRGVCVRLCVVRSILVLYIFVIFFFTKTWLFFLFAILRSHSLSLNSFSFFLFFLFFSYLRPSNMRKHFCVWLFLLRQVYWQLCLCFWKAISCCIIYILYCAHWYVKHFGWNDLDLSPSQPIRTSETDIFYLWLFIGLFFLKICVLFPS